MLRTNSNIPDLGWDYLEGWSEKAVLRWDLKGWWLLALARQTETACAKALGSRGAHAALESERWSSENKDSSSRRGW